MTKPNILWIYCDELRSDALGCYGNPYATMQTPHIDSIAEQGVLFENSFCNSPVCVASRSSILTGLYPEQTGVYHNEAVWPNYRFDETHFGEQCNKAIPITFPEVFAQQGYTTANFGKVHVPAALRSWIHSDVSGSNMMDFYHDIDPADLKPILAPGPPLVIGGVYPGDRSYPADVVTNNTLAWLENVDGPWLTRVSYLQPHTPVFPPAPLDKLYQEGNFPDTIADGSGLSRFEQSFGDVIGTRGLSPQAIFQSQIQYYGLVAWIDLQVGKLLEYLQQRNQLENTIIVFGADHGASLGECGRYQKQTFAPESHRVPRIISWPGTLPKGEQRSELCQSMDLARTLSGLTGVELPEQFQGRDLFSTPASEAIYSTIGYGFASSRPFPNLGFGNFVDAGGNEHGWPRRACVRTDRYRLDKNVRLNGEAVAPELEDIFLADAQADPSENTNLADQPEYAEMVARLSKTLDDHVANSVEVPEGWTKRDRTQPKRSAEFRQKLREVSLK
ncbi:MAG: sulfatase-like hydrolase/transferase [Chloroflexota bacterium]